MSFRAEYAGKRKRRREEFGGDAKGSVVALESLIEPLAGPPTVSAGCDAADSLMQNWFGPRSGDGRSADEITLRHFARLRLSAIPDETTL